MFLGLGCFLTACQPSVEQGRSENAAVVDTPVAYPELLQKAWEAHGGLEDWQQMGSLSFELYQHEEAVERYMVDLNSRKLLISSDTYRIGYDGQDVWYTESGQDDLAASYAGYYHQLHLAFFTLPFMLADESVSYEPSGLEQIQGKNYEGLRISFEDKAEFHADTFSVYFDPDTHRMAWVIHSLDHLSVEQTKKKYARHYRDWQWVNGLLVPLTCESYSWKDDKLGTMMHTQQYLDVQLDALAVDQSMFLSPAEAAIFP